MSKKIYVAARFDRRGEMEIVTEILQQNGYIVTSRWITDEPNIKKLPEEEQRAAHTTWAMNDVADVMNADTLMAFSEDLSIDNPGIAMLPVNGIPFFPAVWARGGRHVEFGIAIALNMRLVVIGPKENIFHHLPQVEQYDDLDRFLIVEKG